MPVVFKSAVSHNVHFCLLSRTLVRMVSPATKMASVTNALSRAEDSSTYEWCCYSCIVEGFWSLEGFGVVNNPYLIVYVCACGACDGGFWFGPLAGTHLCHTLCAKHPTPEVLEQPTIFSCK